MTTCGAEVVFARTTVPAAVSGGLIDATAVAFPAVAVDTVFGQAPGKTVAAGAFVRRRGAGEAHVVGAAVTVPAAELLGHGVSGHGDRAHVADPSLAVRPRTVLCLVQRAVGWAFGNGRRSRRRGSGVDGWERRGRLDFWGEDFVQQETAGCLCPTREARGKLAAVIGFFIAPRSATGGLFSMDTEMRLQRRQRRR